LTDRHEIICEAQANDLESLDVQWYRIKDGQNFLVSNSSNDEDYQGEASRTSENIFQFLKITGRGKYNMKTIIYHRLGE